MNQLIIPTKEPASKQKLNDTGFRVILIPFLGIAIPLLTGLTSQSALSHWLFKLSYLYTIMIAFVVWEGNRYLLFTLRSYFNWFQKPIRKILTLFLAVSFYTIPISILLLVGWYHIFANSQVDWEIVLTTTLVIMICVIFIVHVYETVFLVKESENEMLRNAQLAKAKLESELEALKNQIDPHFVFNSLNTLSHLIEEKPGKARQFNDSLADVYRYILQNKKRDLVLLREETIFIKHFFSLLKIRYEDAVQVNLNIPESMTDQYLLPPISLQALIENAIKHNEFSDGFPLIIDVRVDHGEVIVSNKLRKKLLHRSSSKTGLQNLNERYKLTTGSAIRVFETESEFMVGLPLLKME